MAIEGVDVSHVRGTVQWDEVKKAGKRFAFVKATQGVTFQDPRFKANRAGASAAGLLVGAYHYAVFNVDAEKQVEYFLDYVGSVDRELPPVVDLESGGFEGPTLPPAEVVAWIHEFTEGIHKQTGRHATLYFDPGFWPYTGNSTQFGKRRLWIAHYASKPDPLPPGWTTWTFWQYSSSGTVPGINPPVDLDVFNGDEQALEALTK